MSGSSSLLISSGGVGSLSSIGSPNKINQFANLLTKTGIGHNWPILMNLSVKKVQKVMLEISGCARDMGHSKF